MRHSAAFALDAKGGVTKSILTNPNPNINQPPSPMARRTPLRTVTSPLRARGYGWIVSASGPRKAAWRGIETLSQRYLNVLVTGNLLDFGCRSSSGY